GVDAVRGRMADARALAIEQGEPYRVAVNTDGTKLRIAPDRTDFDTLASSSSPGESQRLVVVIEETFPDKVTAALVDVPDPPKTGDWITIATFKQDGTCKEACATVEVREPGTRSMRVRVRGLNGVIEAVTPGNQQQ